MKLIINDNQGSIIGCFVELHIVRLLLRDLFLL
jgi:hypothetical protein